MYNFWLIVQKIFAIVTVSITAMACAVIIYWQFIQPSQILSNVKGEVFVSNNIIAGGIMRVNRSFCVHNNQYIGEVYRTFSNHMVYQLPNTSTNNIDTNLGCKEKQYIVDIPSVLPSGEYEYRVHISYKINPIKSVSYNLTPVKITVKNPIWDKIKELTEEKK